MAEAINELLLDNPRLAGIAQERIAEKINRIQKQQNANQEQRERSQAKKDTLSLGKAVAKGSFIAAAKESIALGLGLRKEIAEGRFSGFTFFVVLFCSLFKDLADIGLLGTVSWTINLPIFLIMFIDWF